ncbi:MAG: hypothetical protein ACI8QW_000347 [Saprospiraceae bacterium]|jgi:hypothetical protein
MLKLKDSFKGVKSLGVMSYEPPVMLMRKNIRWMIFRNERAPLRMAGGVRGAPWALQLTAVYSMCAVRC